MMKIILIACLFSLTLVSAIHFRPPTSPDDSFSVSDSAPDSIKDYMTSFFAHFGLEEPKQIFKCFGQKDTFLYFTHVQEVTNLVKATAKRDKLQVHLIWLKLKLLHKSLEGIHACMAATEDFTKLLEKLGAKERNPQLFRLAKYIYYQSSYGTLANELPKVTQALDSKDFHKAGEEAGAIVEAMANSLKEKGLALHALNGLWNGVHAELDIPDPQNVWGCWNDETAKVRLEFYYGLAKAVASGDWKEAAVNTEKWYDEKGKELLGKIPKETWDCFKNSDDTKALNAKLQEDITSPEFHEKVNKFVHSYQLPYWGLQKAIKENLEDHNLLHAGSSYANLMKAASKAK